MPASHFPDTAAILRHLGWRSLAGLAAAVFSLPVAQAGEHSPPVHVPQSATYQAECASCHMAYPPGLLPAASWQRLMNNLGQHFGTDASVDPATLKSLTGWLTLNAGTYRKVVRDPQSPPEDRITRSRWFVHEHSEDLSPSVWKRPSIKSPANCAACHRRAEQGVFDEHDIRIPR